MAKFKLRRSRILHEPIKVGSLLRSSSESGRFVKVVEIIPGDFPLVRTHHEYPRLENGQRDYDNPITTHTTDHHDRVVVVNHSIVNWGQETFPKRKHTRTGYISAYSSETAHIETPPGSTHEYWDYHIAKPTTINLSSSQVIAQGQRARVTAEKRTQASIAAVQRGSEYRVEQGKDAWEIPNMADTLRDHRKWQNPYRGNKYTPELSKLWRQGFGIVRSK